MERKTILFQGDSLTDAGRNRTNPSANTGLGNGFVTMIAGQLGCKYPHVDVLNRGVSGNRIGDTYARWLEDMRNVPFDMLSFMHGINDIGFEVRLGRGSDLERFHFIYDRMLWEAKQSHPDAKLVLCQPFVLKKVYDHPQFGNDIYENYDLWAGHMRQRGQVARELAEKYDAIFVPFWDALEEAQKTVSVDDLTEDCVHLTARGNYVLAQCWLKHVEGYIRENWLG